MKLMLMHDPERRIKEAPAVTSTMIVLGSTRIKPNTILPPRPAIVCRLATHIRHDE